MPWRAKVGKRTVGCFKKKANARKAVAGRKGGRVYRVKKCG